MKAKPISRQSASPGSLAPEVQAGQSSPAGQGESGEVGLADGLPAGWAWSDFKSICSKITDGTHHSPPKEAQTLEGEFKYITAKNIKEGGIVFKRLTFLSEEIHRPIYERCNPEKGDVLYIKDGVTTGVATVNQLDEEFSMLSSVALLKPYREAISSEFIKWYLNSPTGFQAMTSQMGGTAIKRLTLKKINAARVPVAPKAEQLRIVSAIESLQERSSRAKQALCEVGPLLSQLRQSVLRGAFSGRLTARWRTENRGAEPASELLARIRTERRERWEAAQLAKYEAKGKQSPKNWQDKYKEPEPVDESELPELPESWCWCPLEELATHQSGFAFKSKHFADEGTQVVKLGNLYQGRFDLTRDPAYLPSDHEDADAAPIEPGDILVSQTGTRHKRDYGFFVLVPDSAPPLLLNQRVLSVQPIDRTLTEWIVFASRTEFYRDFFFSTETGGVNQGNVGVVGSSQGMTARLPTHR